MSPCLVTYLNVNHLLKFEGLFGSKMKSYGYELENDATNYEKGEPNYS